MVKVLAFGSLEEALDHLSLCQKQADRRVDPFLELKAGDFFVRIAGEIVIYGEVLDPALPAFPGKHSKRELAEIREEAQIYGQPHMRHYRFTRCFSPCCPDGELGDVHVSTVQALLSKEQFELAKKNHWPQEDAEVRTLLNVIAPGIA